MAGRLTLLKSTDMGLGSFRCRVLYWYTITPAIVDSLGTAMAPQSALIIPADAVVYLTTADQSGINTGANGFEVLDQVQTAGETLVAFRNRITTDHTARQTAWIAARRAEYANAGISIA